ncbi:ThiF family adenylyltransferase [Occallatibacter riparius]|uniref:ThiF family adenylyltransferase n=1 Tax=Occallatibacter riparius TaxID=1002689 RepID=A0A9J7BU39_9BACT|nr:ThiF family adenylyltransferase [Occallatibacter riparius]UWZ85258.1 ThiF family adenylyltransferase [Occallatibacter riparius]
MLQGPKTALEQVRAIASAPGSPLELLEFDEVDDGGLHIHVSIDCSGIPHHQGGMPLRARERFHILVPKGFPFEVPVLVVSHKRFLGFPHVYWGYYLCLYQAPETEWNPSDGMLGFTERVDLFLRNAAAGTLDRVGAPMHPPTTPASRRNDLPTVIPKADTPPTEGHTWFGFATIENISRRRIDITGWKSILDEEWPDGPVAAAVLLNGPLSHQFPSTIGELITALQERGVNRNTLSLLLRCGLIQTEADAPLLLIIGAPMRGIKGAEGPKQHLTAWWIDPETANRLRLAMPKTTDSEELRSLRADFEHTYFTILEQQRVHWCPLFEDRPEIIVRRDGGTPAGWFRGKSVTVWGCGAIGAQIAEGVARAGAARLNLYDNARIKPGVLLRQPYDDVEVGDFKADALKQRLQRIRPDLMIHAQVADVRQGVLDREDWHDGADIVFDATASRSVLAKLEWTRKTHFHRVPIISLVFGPRARKGMLLVVGPGHSGGPFDASRSAKLRLLTDKRGKKYLEDFFPQTAGHAFQPEPGCSEPTFIGSYSDVASLSHLMLNAVPEILESLHPSEAEARFYSPSIDAPDNTGQLRYRIDGRLQSHDLTSGFEIRISRSAWLQMQRHINQSAWRFGRRVETGGILLGERDESLKLMWVDEFSAPPRDSTLTATEFICGTEGTAKLHEQRNRVSRGSVRYVGMWHTHPDSLPVPSATDIQAMALLSDETGGLLAHSLMIIIGTPYQRLALATYAFSQAELREGRFTRLCAVSHPPSALQAAGS